MNADLRALALQQRIGADRGAVHDGAEIGDAAERVAGPARKPAASSPRCEGTLAVWKRPRRLVEQEQVGERAADIDADDGAAHEPGSS